MLGTRNNKPLLILALILLTGGCTTRQTRKLGDGTEQPLAYAAQEPELAKNAWAEVARAGISFASEPDEQFDIPFWWEFALKVKINELKSVRIYDVSKAPPQLLFNDTEAILQDGVWRARTASRKFSRAVAPWFYTPGLTEHIFKFVLTNNRNEERSLYQPCLHSEAAKQAQVLAIVRLTAPDIKAKHRQASSTAKQPPAEFNVFLPKRPPAPERSYSMSGGKNQQAVAITIRPQAD